MKVVICVESICAMVSNTKMIIPNTMNQQ